MPPHNLQAEQGVLGAVFRSQDVLDSVRLRADDFYEPRHQQVWTAMLEARQQGHACDLVTVLDRLTRSGIDADPSYLTQLADSSALAGRAADYAELVTDCAVRRTLIQRSYEMAHAAQDLAHPLEEAAAMAQGLADAACETRFDESGQAPPQVCAGFLEYLERIQEQVGVGIQTQFEGLNRLTGGFFPGEVTILAARPGCGKTAMALNLGMYSLVQDHPIGIFSLEMPKNALLARLCAAACDVDAQAFRTGQFRGGEIEAMQGFMDKLSQRTWRVYDRTGLTVTEMRSQARRWKREMGVEMLILDYLQLIKPDRRGGSREQEVAEASRSIKEMALELDVPVLLLAQLNREAEKSAKPMLSHLRESGSVEQDADIVLFLSGMSAGVGGDVAQVDLDVAKGRSNSCGGVKLNFLRRFLRFEERMEENGNGY